MKFGLSSIKVDWERFTVPGFNFNEKIKMIKLARALGKIGLVDAKMVVELIMAAVAEHGYCAISLDDYIELYKLATEIIVERDITNALYYVRRYAAHMHDVSQWMANVIASMIDLYYMEVARS